MGRPFDIPELRKNNNKFNVLLSKIGLTFFVCYLDYAMEDNQKIRRLMVSTYKKKENILSRVKNIEKFNCEGIKAVLQYALTEDSRQRLKNKMKVPQKTIKRLAKRALTSFDFNKFVNSCSLHIKNEGI